jgi:branched-subunit amino acid aminotransferase/4-amino-4-deoxychorismate lyase
MHRYACSNREIADASKINLPGVSSAVFYGRGIFTTIAIYDSKPFQWSKHWQRLKEDARATGVDLSEVTEDRLISSLAEIIQINKVKAGRARISIFDQSHGKIWQFENREQSVFLITTANFRHPEKDLRLTVSPYPVNSKSPLAGVKSCNYLENLLVLEEAQRRGFDEAIRLNEKGEAVSAAMANIFWARDGEIFTSPLETGALAGTTRAFVTENFPVSEKKVLPEELKNAEEIFITSAGLGITRIESVEEKNFKCSDAFSDVHNSFREIIYK